MESGPEGIDYQEEGKAQDRSKDLLCLGGTTTKKEKYFGRSQQTTARYRWSEKAGNGDARELLVSDEKKRKRVTTT